MKFAEKNMFFLKRVWTMCLFVMVITSSSDSIVGLTVGFLLNKNLSCPFNTNILLFLPRVWCAGY